MAVKDRREFVSTTGSKGGKTFLLHPLTPSTSYLLLPGLPLWLKPTSSQRARVTSWVGLKVEHLSLRRGLEIGELGTTLKVDNSVHYR